MAHRAQQRFFEQVRSRFPSRFVGASALDCGSLDINGNNRWLFAGGKYTGLDIAPGRNVDVVSKTHEYDAPDGSFDVVISGEALEHDMFYEKSLQAMLRLVRDGGLMLFTCATTGRAEHGTRRTDKRSSPLTTAVDGWSDYYKNLTEADVRAAIDIEASFSEFEFRVQGADLYFWGVKRSG